MISSDIIIIGAGPGGYETAIKAATQGQKVVIIEKQALGGTCLNVGCIPTKCLCRNAEVLETVRQAGVFGVEVPAVSFDLSQAIARKDEVVQKLTAGVASLMKTPGITLVEGTAKFTDAHTVMVGDESYTAPNIIIATGSVTKFLPIEGAHAEGVATSTEMLNLQDVPGRLVIIGGGVIGTEFAHIYNSFGSQVHIVEFLKEILPAFDKDMAKRLRTSLKKKGIQFHVGCAAKAIHAGSPMVVEFEEKGKLQSLEADLVLMAVGRAANVAALNLDDVGITYTAKGILVDEHMQTNIPGIYAIGDVNGLCQLAHAATFQGYCALDHILGKTENTYGESLKLIPAAVFTVPELAMVGKTEEQLSAEGITYNAHKCFYRANGKALSMNEEEGLVKVLVAEDGKVLGAHILGAHASDLIHEVTILMQLGGTWQQLQQTVHAHPSLSEIFLQG